MQLRTGQWIKVLVSFAVSDSQVEAWHHGIVTSTTPGVKVVHVHGDTFIETDFAEFASLGTTVRVVDTHLKHPLDAVVERAKMLIDVPVANAPFQVAEYFADWCCTGQQSIWSMIIGP